MATVSLIHSPHPLLPSVDREISELDLKAGASVLDLLIKGGFSLNENRPYLLLLNNSPLDCEHWGLKKLAEGDVVHLRAAVAGGDSQDKNKTLRTMLIIALLIAAGNYYEAGTIGYGAYTAYTVGGMLLINAMLPPKIPGADGVIDDQNSPTYTISGGTNRFRHYAPMILVLGQHRVVPDLAAQTYSEIEGNDQYLNQAFHFGLSDITLSEYRIGDTLITEYEDYTLEESGPDGVLTQFPGNVDTVAGGPLDLATDWVLRTSSVGTNGLAVHLAGYVFYIDGDGEHEVRVLFGMEYRRVGDVTWLPFYDTAEFHVYHKGREGFRWAHKIDVPEEQYEVRVRVRSYEWIEHHLHSYCPLENNNCQLDEYIDYTDTHYNNVVESNLSLSVNLSWAALLSYQPDAQLFEGQKKVGLRIRATGQLNGQVSQFNALASASAPVWNGSTWITGPTSNPGWWFLWLARGKFDSNGQRLYGAGLPDSGIDIDTIKAWGLWCVTKGLTVNLVFDKAISVSQMLATVARCGRATLTWGNGKLGVIYDQGGQPVTALFGMSNIVRNSFSVEYVTGHLADEVVVEFINPTLGWKPDTVRATVPGVVSPVNPVPVKLLGCTDKVMAGKEANLLAAQQLYRRRFVSWQTDMEGLIVQRGDVVTLSHDLTQWGNSGRLVAGTTTQLTLDRKVTFEAGNNYYIGVRFPNGSYDIYDCFFPGASDRDVIDLAGGGFLPSAPDDDPNHPPLDYLWFFAPQVTPGKKVKIVSIRPAGDKQVTITATDEDDNYYLAENNSYTHVPITQDSTTPSIDLLQVYDTLTRIGNVYATRIDMVWDVSGPYEAAAIRVATESGEFKPVGKTFDRRFSFPWDPVGIIRVELTVFNEAGQIGTGGRVIQTHEILGKRKRPGDVTGFKAFQNGSTISYIWDLPPDVDIESTYIRREPQGRGGTFEDATPVKDKKGTNTTTKDVPPGAWTFLAKHKDTSGLWSPHVATYDLVVDNTQDVLFEFDYAPLWQGTLSGCIRHWSGVLVPSSTSNNAALGWRVFDEPVPDPVDSFYFEAPETDHNFDDTMRTSVTGSAKYLGGTGDEPRPVYSIDYRIATGAYDGYEPWAIGDVTARYIKARVEHDNLTHGPAALDSFTLLVDMPDKPYTWQGINVPASGITYNFPRQFHKPPFVTVQADDSRSLTFSRTNVTETSVDIKVYQSDVAVAAVVDVKAEGA